MAARDIRNLVFIKKSLHMFVKKYENVIVRPLLSKAPTKGNIDQIIACSKWWKSHNYSVWMVSSLIRENVKQFTEKCKGATIVLGHLLEQTEKTVFCLQAEEKVT